MMHTHVLGSVRITTYPHYKNLTNLFQLKQDLCVRDSYQSEVDSYARVLHQALSSIIRDRGFNSGQIKELLRNEKSMSTIKREPVIEIHFSSEEYGKLSLLWIAVLGCYQDSVELLVSSGADVNELFGFHDPQVVDEKWTILHALVQMFPSWENELLIRLVADHGADLQARDSFGRNVLHLAIEHGRIRLTKWFLQKGVEVNVADNQGRTPLHHAAMSSEAEKLVPLLMEHGADVTAKDSYGFNALHHLVDTRRDPAEVGEPVDLARVLIEKGVSIDDRTDLEHGLYQPIHLAVLRRKNELVKLLLDHGADVNARAKDDLFPLYLTVNSINLPLMETLLRHGANIHLKTTKGRTALHRACEMHQRKIIELLLSAGANVLAEDRDGKTPFALFDRRDPRIISGIRPMLEALALKKVCQSLTELKDEGIIKGYKQLWDYFRDCQAHASWMKITRLIKGCNFLDLVAKNHYQIAELMRNPDFEPNFKLYDLSRFSMYAEDILETFERAKKHHRSMVQLEEVIDEAVYHILPYIVVRKVARYLLE